MGKLRYKTINGKRYHCYGFNSSKSMAKQIAKNHRASGKSARILPSPVDKGAYYVWVRKKR